MYIPSVLQSFGNRLKLVDISLKQFFFVNDLTAIKKL